MLGGSNIIVEKAMSGDLIFIGPRGKRLKAFEELKKPANKKDCQIFAGLLGSNPIISLE